MVADLFSPNTAPTFSGHETFALRSNWLKKAYDLLLLKPDLFYLDNAFVLLGVGKNMANSIRFWGRVCGVFDRDPLSNTHIPTALGRALLDDDGWDPFLVTPASRWLLHWQITARPEAAFTWFYTFNLLKGGEFTVTQLARQIRGLATEQGWRVPSESTITRDIECMLNCYNRPTRQITAPVEDLLFCPLLDLGLIQSLPGQNMYRLQVGRHRDLSDSLVAFAVFESMRLSGRQTIAFSELAYAPRSPGRLLHIQEVTEGRAYYTDQAGIRQVAWTNLDDTTTRDFLLRKAFANEVRYV
jgi:hypothetical protein